MKETRKYKKGDIRESDGKIFYGKRKITRKSGKVYEYIQWMTLEAFEKNKQWAAKYRKDPENIKRNKKRGAINYLKNKEKILARQKKYTKNNYDKIKKRNAEYQKRPKVKERERKRVSAWRRNNKKWINDHKRKRIAADPQYAIASRLRCRLYYAIGRRGWKKVEKTQELLGCTFDFLKQHLESKFKNGMSWDKPNSFHIDHIRPLSSFDLTDPEQQKSACHWTNLQPLSPVDNMSKGAKILTTK
jgi:hypothetical protein